MPAVGAQGQGLDLQLFGQAQGLQLQIPDQQRADAEDDQHDLGQIPQPEHDKEDGQQGHGRDQRQGRHQRRERRPQQGNGAIAQPNHQTDQRREADAGQQQLEAGQGVAHQQDLAAATARLEGDPVDPLRQRLDAGQQLVLRVGRQTRLRAEQVGDGQQEEGQQGQQYAPCAFRLAVDESGHGDS